MTSNSHLCKDFDLLNQIDDTMCDLKESESMGSDSLTNESFSEENIKKCSICKAGAIGFHYGAVCCNSCFFFFRRSILNKLVYECKFKRQCIVNKENRMKCNYCRLQECFKAGMKKQALSIISSSTKARKNFRCAVCEDFAFGMSNGVLACDACGQFFRRSLKKKLSYTCKLERKCVITKYKKKSCCYCRLEKCTKVGMKIQKKKSDNSIIQNSPMKTDDDVMEKKVIVDFSLKKKEIDERKIDEEFDEKKMMENMDLTINEFKEMLRAEGLENLEENLMDDLKLNENQFKELICIEAMEVDKLISWYHKEPNCVA